MDIPPNSPPGRDPPAHALVIGAGPAGLMAGKSGLNLTKTEAPAQFRAAYAEAEPALRPMLAAFGPASVQAWAEELGQPLFTGSTGRVFPRAMKASPLLRAWLARLGRSGMRLHRRWCWTGWAGDEVRLDTPQGPRQLTPDVTVLACGGASWARLGSDGAWTAHLPGLTAPFQPANMGVEVAWSSHMTPHLGRPIKAVALRAGAAGARGELVLTRHGIEGGGIYALSPALRRGLPLTLDLLPDLDEATIRARLARPRGKASRANHLRKTLRLGPVKQALLMECARPLPDDLAPLLKALPVPYTGPRPLDDAISTAGGLRFDALDAGLMLRARPGTFACGEMLDWEAPTGGYLLTACLATGRWAGRAAAVYIGG